MANPFFNPQAPVWGCAAFMAALLSPNLLTGPLGTQTPTARAPLRAPQNVAPWRQAALQPNLLESTLGAPPFASSNWQISRSLASARGDARGGMPLAIFAGAQGQPVTQYDWPLPRAAVRLEQTWAQNLLSSTLAPAITYQLRAPLKAPQNAAPRVSLSEPPNLLMTLLASTGAPAPFSNPDSRLSRGWAVDRSAGGFAATIYLPANTPPLSLYDWPLPARAPRLEQTWTQSLLSSTLAPVSTSVPFTQAQPIALTAQRFERSWSQNLLLSTLYVSPTAPLNLYDSRLPTAKARLEQNWIGLNMVLGAPVQVTISRPQFKAARDHSKFIAQDDDREFIAARDKVKFWPV